MGKRCNWVRTEADAHYHDTEWGRPSRDDRHLFEMLILEGAQAGLSWSTILNKRENYRAAFANFDADAVARFTPAQVEALMQNPGIVRNRLKIESAIANARAVQRIRAEHGSLAVFLWSFVGDTPVQNGWHSYRDAPASTEASDALSKALKRYGCKFVGSTICYALMQAIGMVNDHEFDCPCRAACAALGKPAATAAAKGAASPAAGAANTARTASRPGAERPAAKPKKTASAA
ncbi:DNA-3-methyladenine glycosylase I [Burkholderia glumae]|uniref:DNA-3-methyladenine glycosylase I n=2 Tax=Burkholderia glumae TaxID=337 RepID=UPI0014646878|nr:DNA-3-methyladenine glycosylase I [Burkholderia glumae]MCM2491699.1 DNA-3-methyladenine glycosylase I [Burkholderia glumae]MCM2542687.1 DNA-3-methyladenine glycosylase I [Burkholderia glumae]QJP73227.1 DNA-3-methyladenine glycosylase I [Burkholderia glumae]UVS94425.1 DNA-3-methyladenine glycosylase I [Burkholderia glumae]